MKNLLNICNYYVIRYGPTPSVELQPGSNRNLVLCYIFISLFIIEISVPNGVSPPKRRPLAVPSAELNKHLRRITCNFDFIKLKNNELFDVI
jgi:hypothetical protein